jgi:hypothetical protein
LVTRGTGKTEIIKCIVNDPTHASRLGDSAADGTARYEEQALKLSLTERENLHVERTD